ncbi:hypothetical protein SLS54_010751 [Diplodia seriata]
MGDFPDDIKILIVEELKLLLTQITSNGWIYYEPKLCRYAGISQAWNRIIERTTFQQMHVTAPDLAKSKHGEYNTTDSFKQMMDRDGGRRRALVRRLRFTATHPYDLRTPKARTDAGSAANDLSFSRSLRNFLRILAAWPATGKPLALELRHEPHGGLPVQKLPVSFRGYHPPEDDAVLSIVGDRPLPKLCVVSNIDAHLRLWPASLMHLVAAMDGLASLEFFLDEHSTVDARRRQEYRKGLLFSPES